MRFYISDSILKKMLVFLALFLCFAIFSAGCTGRSKRKRKTKDGKAILYMWHTMNTEESITLKEIINEFEQENPDLKVDLQPVPFDQAQNKYKITAQAGDAPDIFRSEIAWTCEEAALGYLLELDNYISDKDKKDYMRGPLKYNIYKGHYYGIPQVTDCLALLYNKRIFKERGLEVPKTMKEFASIGQKLTIDVNGKNASEPGFDQNNVMQWAFYFTGKAYDFQPFLWAFGGGLLDPEKKEILINNKGSIDGLVFLIDLRDKYHIIPPKFGLKSSYDNMMVGFKDGRGTSRFYVGDILKWDDFLKNLKNAETSAKKRVLTLLDAKSKRLIADWNLGDSIDLNTKKTIVNGLNRILEKRDFYNQKAFADIKLTEEGNELLKRGLDRLNESDSIGFNRLLINSIYPDDISMSQGLYAMIFNGPWSTADILKGKEFKYNNENLGIAIIPKGPGGYGSPVGGHNYVISRSCPYPDNAYRLIYFLNLPKNQAKLAIRNNLLPTRKSTYELPEIKSNSMIQSFGAQLEVAVNRPVVPQGGLIYNEFNPYLQAAYLGAMTPKHAMDEIANNWRKMMGW